MKKFFFKIFFLVFISSSFFASTFVLAQSDKIDLIEVNQKRIALQKKSMYVLGGWAVSNFAYSGTALTLGIDNGETKYFHQFNLYWNTVNFALAGSNLLFGKKNTDLNYSQTLKAYHSTEKLFLLNTGIDVGYIATGLYLRERANTSTDRKTTNRLLGYGKSLILQGGFLFVFDLTDYFLTKNQSKILYTIPVSIAFAPNQMRINYTF